MNIKSYAFLTLVVFGLVLMAGCGGGAKVVPVSGTVTIDGEPAYDCRITFQPTGGDTSTPGPGAAATTDAEGKFTLLTVEDKPREGATPGANKVMIFWLDPANFDQDEGDEAPEATPPPFTLPIESGDGSLVFEVPDGGTDAANFEF